MDDILGIYIDIDNEARLVGRCRMLTKKKHTTSQFEYDASWLAYEGCFSIDPQNLPIQEAPIYTRRQTSSLPGAIRDTAPDRWGQKLIRRAFEKSGAERHLTEFDYLLAINDDTRIGALRYKRPGEEDFEHDVEGYRVPPLLQLPALLDAANAVSTDSETAADLKILLNEGSPLGGARPKSAVQDGDVLAIAKFPKPDDERSIAHGEVLALTLAKMAGINAAEARLVDVVGRAVSIIKRFDRKDDHRIPFLSAMSLLGKTDGEGGTYIEIAEMIRVHSSAPKEDLHELFRRIIFNVLISNHDDHLRNHAFLHDTGEHWRLSPAYDLNPVPIADTDGSLQTAISDESDDANLDIAMSACAHFKLKTNEAKEIIDGIVTVTKGWRHVAGRIGMSAGDQKRYASAFHITESL